MAGSFATGGNRHCPGAGRDVRAEGYHVPGQKDITFRGKPYHETKWFVITEFGFLNALENTNQRIRRPDAIYVSDLGVMRNITSRVAVGLTLTVSHSFYDQREEIYTRLGFHPRVRYWISNGVGVDLAPGVLLVESEADLESPQFSAHVDITIGDWASVVTQVEILRFDGPIYNPERGTSERVQQDELAVFAGVKFGSYLGAGVTVAALVGSAAAIAF